MQTIASTFSPDEAIRRLGLLLTNAQRAGTLSGQVDGSSITMMRVQRYGNSIFRPQFSGVVEKSDAGSVLTGKFGLSRLAKIVFSIWLVLVSVWTGATALLAAKSDMHDAWVLPLAGVGLLLVGLLFFAFARSYYSSDRQWLAQTLADELRRPR